MTITRPLSPGPRLSPEAVERLEQQSQATRHLLQRTAVPGDLRRMHAASSIAAEHPQDRLQPITRPSGQPADFRPASAELEEAPCLQPASWPDGQDLDGVVDICHRRQQEHSQLKRGGKGRFWDGIREFHRLAGRDFKSGKQKVTALAHSFARTYRSKVISTTFHKPLPQPNQREEQLNTWDGASDTEKAQQADLRAEKERMQAERDPNLQLQTVSAQRFRQRSSDADICGRGETTRTMSAGGGGWRGLRRRLPSDADATGGCGGAGPGAGFQGEASRTPPRWCFRPRIYLALGSAALLLGAASGSFLLLFGFVQ